MRGIYQSYSNEMETRNFFKQNRKMKKSWYEGNTGLPPVDYAIKNASYDWIKWPETKNEVSPKTNVHKIKNLDIEKEVSKSEQSIETFSYCQ